MSHVARWILLACCLGPLAAGAEVFKCRSGDGTVRYTDQPCPGTKPESRPAPGAPAAMAPAAAAASRNSDQGGFVARRSGASFDRGPPPRQKDIDEVREAERRVTAYMTEAHRQCGEGDNRRCVELACMTLDRTRGPVEHFAICAKARGLTAGDRWILLRGRPSPDPNQDKFTMAAALTPRLPAGRHESSYSVMDLLCVPPAPAGREVATMIYRVQEVLYVAPGPSLRHAYTLGQFKSSVGAAAYSFPEYATFAELAERTCAQLP